MFNLLFLLVNTAIIYFTMMNLVPLRPRKWQCILLFSYTYIAILSLYRFGQIGSYLAIAFFLLLLALFSTQKLLNVCCAMFGYLCNVCLNYFFLMAARHFFHLSLAEITQDYSFLFSCVFFITIFTLTFLLGRFLRKTFQIQEMRIPQNVLIAVCCHLLLCVCLFIFNFVYGERIGYPTRFIITNSILYCIFFMITTTLILFIIKILEKEMQTQKKLVQYESLQAYTEHTEALYQEIHLFRHDYSNILSTLYGFIEKRDMDGLDHYFTNHILSTAEIFQDSYYDIGNLSRIQLNELKGFLYLKIVSAIERKLNVTIDIAAEVTHINMDILDFIRILGIYIDNAIEAAELSEARQFEISVRKTEEENLWLIGNSCDSDRIPFTELDIMSYSTKGSNRGLGLYNASQVLDKYPRILHHTRFENHYFTQQLEDILGR